MRFDVFDKFAKFKTSTIPFFHFIVMNHTKMTIII